ncbi:MAG: TonB-dependent receptor [Gammaproteobacteria bacterium]|nr:TonB-dependent receptor [Gammaproteobacteria bacterium]MYC52880.1 TonB-dependent receptor [Gammaproteobacteria bacterium]
MSMVGVIATWAIPALAGIAGPQAAPDSADASLHGAVTGVFRERTSVLPHALLAVETPTGRRWVQAGEDGRYLLGGLRSGVVTVRVRHPGYEAIAVEVTLAAGASVRVDLELTGRPLRLDPVEVRADRLTGGSTAGDEPGQPRPIPELEIQALDLTPGVGDPALAAAVRALPGNDPASATDVLYLRGSTADMKLVLLDGAPVYTPFHVAGLMPGFEPALLGAAALHRGGAPARYDGGLTHILDLRTRSPRRDRLRASAALDLLTASGAAEGPLGARGGFLASARGLHDVGSEPLGGDRPYGYSDLLLAAEYEPGDDQRFGVTAFRNSEAVLLDYEAAPDDATWTNRALSLSYEGAAGGARVRALAAASDYDASLPLQPASTDSVPAAAPLLATGANRRARLLAEVEWGGAAARTVVGVSHNYIRAEYGARAPAAGATTTTTATHSTAGVHVDAVRLLAPEVTLRAGVRADLFPDGELALAPRARLAWAFDPRALLSVAVGRYHQPTRTPDVEVERTLQEVVSSDLSAPQLLPVARADHVVVSLDQLLAGQVRLGLHGYWKGYEGLAAASSGGESIRSSGVDLRLSSAGEREVIWLGYGLSWFWSDRDLSGYSRDFAGRHLLTAGVSSELWGPVRGEFRLVYGAGLPYTAIPFRSFGLDQEAAAPTAPPPPDPPGPDHPVATPPAAADSPLLEGLDDDFLRLDFELHARLTTQWGGHDWSIRPYLRVLNALQRRDALFYAFQPWRADSLTPLAERPFLPVIGVAITF